MPQDPGFIDKVNYVVDFWVNPCAAPWSVYIKLAKDPGIELFLDYIIPSPTDVAYNYLRPGKALGPAGMGGSRPGKKSSKSKGFGSGKGGGAWKKVPGLGQDTGAWLGNRLPGAEHFQDRPIQDGEKFFWRIGDRIQRVLFYLWLGNALSKFFYDWAVLLDETEFCQSQFRGGFHYEGGPFNFGGVIPCNAVFAPTELWQEGACGYFGNQGFVGSRPWNVLVSIDCENIGPFPSNFQVTAGATDLDGPHNYSSKVYFALPGTSFGVNFNFPLRGPGEFNLIACATPSTLIKAKQINVLCWGGGLPTSS